MGGNIRPSTFTQRRVFLGVAAAAVDSDAAAALRERGMGGQRVRCQGQHALTWKQRVAWVGVLERSAAGHCWARAGKGRKMDLNSYHTLRIAEMRYYVDFTCESPFMPCWC